MHNSERLSFLLLSNICSSFCYLVTIIVNNNIFYCFVLVNWIPIDLIFTPTLLLSNLACEISLKYITSTFIFFTVSPLYLYHSCLQSGFTPLHIASHYGNINVGRLLIERKADVDFKARVR